MKYFYSYGGLSTDKPFLKPTLDLLKTWYLEWIESCDTSDYKVWLVGSAAESFFGDYPIQPNDIDIAVMNDIKDPQHLYNIMYKATELGIKHRIPIDIFHVNNLHKKFDYEPCIQTRCYRTVTTLGYRGERKVIDLGYKDIIKEYECGLVSFERKVPRDSFYKRKQRVESTLYKHIYIDLVNLKDNVKWK